LEDEGGGDLIDDAAVVLAGVASFIEDLVRFAGGEAFVPEMNRQPGEGAKLRGEGLGLEGTGAGIAGEMNGIANDDGDYAETAGEAGQGAKIVAGVAVDFKGENGLGGEAQFIGDGDADALGADVKGEVAGNGCWLRGIGVHESSLPLGRNKSVS